MADLKKSSIVAVDDTELVNATGGLFEPLFPPAPETGCSAPEDVDVQVVLFPVTIQNNSQTTFEGDNNTVVGAGSVGSVFSGWW